MTCYQGGDEVTPETLQALQNIATILAILVSALSVYLSWQKVGNKSKEEAVWRALVDKKLQDIVDTVKEMKDNEKSNTKLIAELATKLSGIDMKVSTHDALFEKVWSRIDDLKKMVRGEK